MRFAMTGAAGYIAPRHLKAIKESGNQLALALDPAPKALGSLIDYFPDTHYTNCAEDFDARLRVSPKALKQLITSVSVRPRSFTRRRSGLP